jgi:hypothetical protein
MESPSWNSEIAQVIEEVAMSRCWKFGGIALLALAMLAPAASARPPFLGFRGYVGPRIYGPAFYYGPRFYGPAFYGWYGVGFYGLGWYEPYGFVPGPVAGKVKIDAAPKDTQVYVDSGYAGTVSQLGTFPLKAGTHDIELRGPDGQTLYQEHIEVIAGKTITLKP